MTRHEKMLAGVILGEIRDMNPEKAAEHLAERGLLNRRACEQRAVRGEIERLARQGVLRCEAMHATAETLCCSYEKVRGLYYNEYKS